MVCVFCTRRVPAETSKAMLLTSLSLSPEVVAHLATGLLEPLYELFEGDSEVALGVLLLAHSSADPETFGSKELVHRLWAMDPDCPPLQSGKVCGHSYEEVLARMWSGDHTEMLHARPGKKREMKLHDLRALLESFQLTK